MEKQPQELAEKLGFEPEYVYDLSINGDIDLDKLEIETDRLIRQNTTAGRGRYEEFHNTVQYKFDNSDGRLKIYIAPRETNSNNGDGSYSAYKVALIFWIRIEGWFGKYKDY